MNRQNPQEPTPAAPYGPGVSDRAGCPMAEAVGGNALQPKAVVAAELRITAYQADTYAPGLRAAGTRRDWMDAAALRAPYRCLPLVSANGYGWELLTPWSFTALWNGGPGIRDVEVIPQEAVPDDVELPTSHFGEGVLTFRAGYLFRTPPGYSLHIGGPPNAPKDGISPLTGVVETDWLPFTFTMNWAFTRAGVPVTFAQGEPFCHLFPVVRGLVESARAEIRDMADDPSLQRDFLLWKTSRSRFLRALEDDRSPARHEGWQRYYMRGEYADGRAAAAEHQTKVRAAEFVDRRRLP